MNYIGIDGGGTKTKATVMDSHGNVLGIGSSGPSSIDTVSFDESLTNILQAINNTNVDLHKDTIDSIFMGLGGISCEEDEIRVANNFIKNSNIVLPTTKVVAKNDAYNAFGSGLPLDKSGCILIVGTGSIAFGKCNNLSHRAGGYSYKEGEPGSSYALGKQVIGLISKYHDSRITDSSLTKDVTEYLNIKTTVDIIRLAEEYYADRTKTASLAKFVTKHALLNDSYAISIIENATDELALMVEAVDKTIKLDNKKLAIIGSLGNDKYFFKILESKIKQIDTNYKVFESILDPVIGACIIALRADNIELSEDKINKLKEISNNI